MIDASTSCLTTAGALPLASPYATLWTKRPGSDHPRRSMELPARAEWGWCRVETAVSSTRTRRMRYFALHLPVLHGCDVTHQVAAQPPLTEMAFMALPPSPGEGMTKRRAIAMTMPYSHRGGIRAAERERQAAQRCGLLVQSGIIKRWLARYSRALAQGTWSRSPAMTRLSLSGCRCDLIAAFTCSRVSRRNRSGYSSR